MLNPKDIVGTGEDRYAVERLLAQGGMSNLYLCRPVVPKKDQPGLLVLKEMTVSYRDPQEQARALDLFKREAEILDRLSHQNLPKVWCSFSERNRNYFVMEFVEGEDLGKIIGRNPSGLKEAVVLRWAIDIATVLHYLHVQKPPIIFRDLKPSNIMISAGRIKLIDFGIARRFDHFKKKDTMRIGSPGYAPPEQYSGQTDARSDIFSFGVTLHQLLTGLDPTENQTPFRFVPVRQVNPSVSAGLEAIVRQATALEPGNRFASALEMKRALQALAGIQTGPLTGTLPAAPRAAAPPAPSLAPPLAAPPGPVLSAPPTRVPAAASSAGMTPPTGAGPSPAPPAGAAPPSGSTPSPGPPGGIPASPPPAPGDARSPRGTKPSPPPKDAVPAVKPAILAGSTPAGRPHAAGGRETGRSAPARPPRPAPAAPAGSGGIAARLARLLRSLVVLALPVLLVVGIVAWQGDLVERLGSWLPFVPAPSSPSPLASPSLVPSASPAPRDPLAPAREMIASGRRQEAMDSLEAHLAGTPSDSTARLLWSNALAGLGRGEPLRLQVLVPPDPAGKDLLHGLMLGQSHANRHGGVQGHPVILDVVEAPPGAGPDALGSWVGRATADRALAAVALLPRALLEEAGRAYHDAGIPLLAPGCPSQDAPPGVRGLARAPLDPSQAVPVVAGEALPQAAIVTVDVGAAPGRAPSASPASPPGGVVGSPAPSRAPAPGRVLPAGTDVGGEVARIHALAPRVVIVRGDAARILPWLLEARRHGLTDPVLTTSAALVDPADLPPGVEASGLYVLTSYSPESDEPAVQAFVACVDAALPLPDRGGSRTPGSWAALGYELLGALGAASSESGPAPTLAALGRQLPTCEFRPSTPLGSLASPGEGGTPRPPVALQLKAGAWTTVKASN